MQSVRNNLIWRLVWRHASPVVHRAAKTMAAGPHVHRTALIGVADSETECPISQESESAQPVRKRSDAKTVAYVGPL